MKLSITPRGYIILPDEKVCRFIRVIGLIVSIAIMTLFFAMGFFSVSSLGAKLFVGVLFGFSMYLFINYFTEIGIKARCLKNGILTNGKVLETRNFGEELPWQHGFRVKFLKVVWLHVGYQDRKGADHNEWIECYDDVARDFELKQEKVLNLFYDSACPDRFVVPLGDLNNHSWLKRNIRTP